MIIMFVSSHLRKVDSKWPTSAFGSATFGQFVQIQWREPSLSPFSDIFTSRRGNKHTLDSLNGNLCLSVLCSHSESAPYVSNIVFSKDFLKISNSVSTGTEYCCSDESSLMTSFQIKCVHLPQSPNRPRMACSKSYVCLCIKRMRHLISNAPDRNWLSTLMLISHWFDLLSSQNSGHTINHSHWCLVNLVALIN